MNKISLYSLDNLIGKTIQFNSKVESTEIDFDEYMKAVVLKWEYVHYDYNHDYDVIKIQVDFSKFEEDNKKFMKSNYYDKDGIPCLKWCDKLYYPKDGKDTFYIENDRNNCPFDVI